MTYILPYSFRFSTDLWINSDVDNYFYSWALGAGIKVDVHHYTTYPRTTEKGIAIHPGVEAYLSIEERHIRNLPMPYSKVDCVSDTDKIDSKLGTFEPNVGYNYERCILNCMLDVGFKGCGCNFDTEPFCTLLDYYACVRGKINNYFTECDCLRPCKYTEYDTRLSTLAIPTPSYINHATVFNLTHTNAEDIRNNMINLKVFYPDLQTTTIKQNRAYTPYELISNLGGQLGLFLGASLISLSEIIEFILKSLIYRCKRLIKPEKNAISVSDDNKLSDFPPEKK